MLNGTKSKTAILCVDDHQDSCELIAALLGCNDYHVEQATSAKEGLRKARRGNYSLILLDLRLGDASGVEVCRHIRRFDKRTPILFYSAEARHSHIREAMNAGAQDFLVKPVNPDDILKKVRQYTGQSKNH